MNNNHIIYYTKLLILFLMLLPEQMLGYEVKDFTYTHIGARNGLSSQRAFSLYETNDGAVWTATKTGINRYNGSTASIYKVGSDMEYNRFAGRVLRFAHGSKKLEQPYIFDNGGRIYIFNKIQDRFDLVADVSKMLSTDVVMNDMMLCENDGKSKYSFLVAIRQGVYMLKDDKLTAIHKGMSTNCIQPLKNGTLLFCTNKGVFLHAKNGKHTLISKDDVISTYYDENEDKLWLGTFNNGLKCAKTAGASAWKISDYGTSVPNNPIRAIKPFGNKILIGIDGAGVYQIDNTFTQSTNTASLLFSANDGPSGVLHGNGIYDILIDSWNNVVMASYSGGLDIARPVGSTTAIFSHSRNNINSIISNHVNCVAQYTDNYLLMGTDDGISVLNSGTGQWFHPARGLVVLDMCQLQEGKMLIATYGNGVCQIDKAGKLTKLYSTENGTLQDDHVYSLACDRQGNLWIGTLFGKLTVKTATGLQYYDLDNIHAIKQLSDDRMAIGTAYGLYTARADGSKPQRIKYGIKGDNTTNHYVLDVYEDQGTAGEKNIYIATDGGGVYIYNERTQNTTQLTTANSLPSNSVSSITKDKSGRIWFGTEKGLSYIYPQKPKDVVDVNYCYGLNTEYMRGAVTNLKNGDLLYGTIDAAIIVNPKNVQKINYTAALTLTRVEVQGKEGRTVSAEDREKFNEVAYQELANNEINLKYCQNTFSISFESINLRNQFDIAYQYKIGNNEWSEPFTQQYINFENLEPGTHELYIRCISKTSKAILDQKELYIHIAEPWWNKWWMWIIYLFILGILLYSVWWVYQMHNKYMKLMYDKVYTTSIPSESQSTVPSIPSESGTKDSNKEENTGNEDEEENTGNEDEEENIIPSDGEEFVNKATKAVLDNITDTDFTIDTLCREMAMSRTLFYVKLKTYTGRSPQDFVKAIRLERAASLLKQGKTVSEVAILTGFDNPKYFSTVFKKYFDISPSKYH